MESKPSTSTPTVNYTIRVTCLVMVILLLEVFLGCYMYHVLKLDFHQAFMKEVKNGVCKEEVRRILKDPEFSDYHSLKNRKHSSDSESYVEFFNPNLKSGQKKKPEVDSGVWLTDVTRVTLGTIQEFCKSTIQFCPELMNSKRRRRRRSIGSNGQALIFGSEKHESVPGPPGPPGNPGPPGPTGPSGVKGEQGPQGKNGKNGFPGLPGPPGTDGAAGKDGLPGLLGKEGPVGPPGPRSYPGAPGPQGEKGKEGKRGLDGLSGIPGNKGQKGEYGPSGIPGNPGEKGDTGSLGPLGLPGIPGKKGDVGKEGLPGFPGNPGEKGDMGKIGPAGLPGIPGDKGRVGREGLPGLPGISGEKGNKGDAGYPGLNGVPGTKGNKGERGIRGIPGPTGPGSPGICGNKLEIPNTPTPKPQGSSDRHRFSWKATKYGNENYPGLPPQATGCVLRTVGEPKVHGFFNEFYGSWMVDSYPVTEADAEKSWVTTDEDNILLEYDDLSSFLLNKTYTLDESFKGNAHAIYKGAFFYQPSQGNPRIIKYSLNDQTSQVLHIPGLTESNCKRLYTTDYNYLDFSVDENGLWVIFAVPNSNNTAVMQVDADTMTTQFIWNITVNHLMFNEMFVTSGVLYAIDNITEDEIRISFVLDLFTRKLFEVDIDIVKQFGLTTMATYDHRKKQLMALDKGWLLSYPVTCEKIKSKTNDVPVPPE